MAGSCSRAASSSSSGSSARATTRSAARWAPAPPARSPPVMAVSELGEAVRSAPNTANGSGPAQEKAGSHREATLYHALAGAGAGDGRTLEELRETARAAFQTLPLPVWRRSGFWTTSLAALDLDALDTDGAAAGQAGAVPDVVARTLPDGPRAGRIVQSG